MATRLKSRTRTPLTRSEQMSRVKAKDSEAELALRSALHRTGLRFRKHRRVEGIAVDIVLPIRRVAVFVDGCFWHGCPVHATYPKTNQEYWLPKLCENRERDQSSKLRRRGWRVVRVWEHACLPVADTVLNRILKVVRWPLESRATPRRRPL